MISRLKTICIAFACIAPFHSLNSARIVPGNAPGSQSFTFALGAQAHNATGSIVFTGALTQGVAQEYALAVWGFNAEQFSPFAPEIVTLNGVADQNNPLYNAAITHLGIFGVHKIAQTGSTLPIAVTSAAPATLLYAQSPTEVFSVPEVKDATGASTQAILAVEGFQAEAIFAAVTSSTSPNFGQPGSGIAVAELKPKKDDDNCSQTSLVQINARPGSVVENSLASALDVASPSIRIGSDVVSISNEVDLWYSEHLKRLYIALQVQGDAGPADGARGVVVGSLIDKKLTFYPIAPDAALTLQDKIIGGTGANTQVSIHKVRTMRTTTGLDYLIVLGGIGTPAGTQNQVYALPLVNLSVTNTITASPVQGTLADVTSAPMDFYTHDTADTCSTLPSLFAGRAFVVPATAPNELFTNTSVQALVGITALPQGNITDICVSNDVVFVSVAQPNLNQLPGIFYSQALFDASGAVAAWTPWQRVAGTIDPVYSLIYRSAFGSFAWLTGPSAVTVDTVKETIWGMGASTGLGSLVTLLESLFPLCSAGIQGFFDFPLQTPGLFDISLYVATGLNQVVLVQSGSVIAGTYTPTLGNFSVDFQNFTNGEITQTLPVGTSTVVAISGGALADLGPLDAAAIGVNSVTNNGYLFVGGACGLAVLAQPDGTGWSTANALSANLAGLTAGMRFAILGSYSFVRKLIYDEGFLYVLTDTRLDRIDVAASNFATGVLAVVTVATLADVGCADVGTLFDVAVSHSFALLASSNGLYRVGNNANIQTAPDNSSVDWTEVSVPEGGPVVTQLQPIASNNMPNGFAKTANGNVYVLDAYIGLDTAQENRYTVQSVVAQPITDNTIVPLPDMNVKNILTAFNRFNAFVDLVNVDGTDNFSARNRKLITNFALRDELYTVAPTLYDRNVPVPLEIEDASLISAITRSSASGAWLVAGDFGLRVNE